MANPALRDFCRILGRSSGVDKQIQSLRSVGNRLARDSFLLNGRDTSYNSILFRIQ